jgi:hypothetical protein
VLVGLEADSINGRKAPSVSVDSINLDLNISDAKLLERPQDAKQFPFETVRSSFGSLLAAKLSQIEIEDKREPHTQFVTALNCVLVWTQARTATLPTWEWLNQHETTQLLALLSEWSRDLQIDEVIIVTRRRIYPCGTEAEQGVIARRNCPRVHLEPEPPIRDDELGRELDMYPRNAEQFAAGLLEGETQTAFSIWEAGADVLLYAERWSEALLSPSELQEFIVRCEERVALWNSSMESLGLPYRVYGTMDWRRRDVPWHEAVNTKRVFGKEFIGIVKRGKGDFDVEPREKDRRQCIGTLDTAGHLDMPECQQALCCAGHTDAVMDRSINYVHVAANDCY